MKSIPALDFAEGGWCEALKASYAPGRYVPKTREEYEALAPYAVDAPELPDDIEDDDDEPGAGGPTVKELKAQLKELGVTIPRGASKADMLALLAEAQK